MGLSGTLGYDVARTMHEARMFQCPGVCLLANDLRA
jgi:hypothetical protein